MSVEGLCGVFIPGWVGAGELKNKNFYTVCPRRGLQRDGNSLA